MLSAAEANPASETLATRSVPSTSFRTVVVKSIFLLMESSGGAPLSSAASRHFTTVADIREQSVLTVAAAAGTVDRMDQRSPFRVIRDPVFSADCPGEA